MADDASPHRPRLVAFYKRHAPEKLDDVDRLLEKYAGKEVELFAALNAKYVVTLTRAATVARPLSSRIDLRSPLSSAGRGLMRAASMVRSTVQSDVDLVRHRVSLLLGENGIVLDWLQGLKPDERRSMIADIAAARASGATRLALGAVLRRHATALSSIALPKGSCAKINQEQCVRDLAREPLLTICGESFTPMASDDDPKSSIDHVIAELDRRIDVFAAGPGDAFEVRKHVMRCAARTTAADGYFALAALVGDAFIVTPQRSVAPIAIELSEHGGATVVVPSTFLVRRQWSGAGSPGAGSASGCEKRDGPEGAQVDGETRAREPTGEDEGLVVDVVVTRVLDFAKRSGTHTVRIAVRDDLGGGRRSGEQSADASATAPAEGAEEEEEVEVVEVVEEEAAAADVTTSS